VKAEVSGQADARLSLPATLIRQHCAPTSTKPSPSFILMASTRNDSLPTSSARGPAPPMGAFFARSGYGHHKLKAIAGGRNG
jgi:hypothetical protein